MELRRAIETRRMTRDFAETEVADDLVAELVDLASRAPSAGKTQGWSLLVLRDDARRQFWDLSLPADKREGFAWPGLLRAPVVALSFADPDAYVARYSEADKAHTGLGVGVDKWGAPYWTIDASMATMTSRPEVGGACAALTSFKGARLIGASAGEVKENSSVAVRLEDPCDPIGCSCTTGSISKTKRRSPLACGPARNARTAPLAGGSVCLGLPVLARSTTNRRGWSSTNQRVGVDAERSIRICVTSG